MANTQTQTAQQDGFYDAQAGRVCRKDYSDSRPHQQAYERGYGLSPNRHAVQAAFRDSALRRSAGEDVSAIDQHDRKGR